MKIIALHSENVKRLSVVDITPDPDESLVIVGGRNGQGKSSVLDSIAFALGGKDLVCEVPIRKGEKKAVITVDVGDLVIERSFTPTGTYLTVKNREGAKMASPQAVLDKLVGKLTFDPLAFARMGGTADGRRRQAAILREVYGLDFSKEEEQHRTAYAARTFHNRQLLEAKTRLDATPAPAAETPEKEIVFSDLVAELKRAQEHNRGTDDLAEKAARIQLLVTGDQADLERQEKGIRAALLQIEEIRKQIKGMEANGALLQDSIDKRTDQINRLKKEQAEFVLQDTAAIETKIANAEQVNKAVRAKQARKALADQIGEINKKIAAQERVMADAERAKAAKLQAAEFPIDGLAVDDDGVNLAGVPLDQASQAEQLKLSVAIGLAQNPKLKVMMIRDGSLLDDQSLRMLARMAAEADSQLWVERVGQGKECSVIIENGEVKA